MSAPLTLLAVLLFFVVLALAGPRWGADTRAPGGWRPSRDAQPLWPVDAGSPTRSADRAPTQR